MNTFKIILYSAILGLLLLTFGCADNPLDEQPYSQVAPENLFESEGGVRSVLASAYANASFMQRTRINQLNEWQTDISWQTGGGENRQAVLFINFTWDPTDGSINNWYNNHYNAIRDANTLIENIDVADISQEQKDQITAEARFIRAFAYFQMHKKFGPVPLRKSTQDPLEMARASEQEIWQFIENELEDAATNLPAPGQVEYGRATKGAAYGVLTKFFLNTKQWPKVLEASQSLMDLNYYQLFDDYASMFDVPNEGNREMIWVFTADPSVPPANNIMNGTQPPGWRYWPKRDLTYMDSWNNWASQYRIRDAFYNSFDPDDERLVPFVTEYVNAAGDTVNLADDGDNIRCFKYMPTAAAQGNFYGNDYPIIRYADILLSRAEALVRENGMNQESVNLINQVRERAGLTGNDQISLGDFGSEAELLDHILAERGWEFYYEGKRREDLIRHGEFISRAQARGVNAQPHHVLLPIPQPAMDSNPSLVQNDGY